MTCFLGLWYRLLEIASKDISKCRAWTPRQSHFTLHDTKVREHLRALPAEFGKSWIRCVSQLLGAKITKVRQIGLHQTLVGNYQYTSVSSAEISTHNIVIIPCRTQWCIEAVFFAFEDDATERSLRRGRDRKDEARQQYRTKFVKSIVKYE